MTKRHRQMKKMPETRMLHAALFALGFFVLAGAGFFGAYALAGAWYPRDESPGSQQAAVAEIVRQNEFASTTLIAKAAYVYDMTDDQVLYQNNANEQLPLASLTKIALVLSVIQALPQNTLVSTPAAYAALPSGGTERLPAGETWNIDDAISFTLTASSDDGANLLAQAANDAIHQEYPQSPAQGATVWRMNNLVQQLGLTETYYLNDTGLDISTTQSGAYGSAHDMATLFAYAASTSPQTFAATTQPNVTIYSTTGVKATGSNTDTALDAIPGIVMGKTGYTDLAGGNLAVVFDTNGHEIVAVVLGSTEDGRFSDMEQLVPAAQKAVSEGE